MKVLSRINTLAATGWIKPAVVEQVGNTLYFEPLFVLYDDKGYFIDREDKKDWMYEDLKHSKTIEDAVKVFGKEMLDNEDPEDMGAWLSDDDNFENTKSGKFLKKLISDGLK